MTTVADTKSAPAANVRKPADVQKLFTVVDSMPAVSEDRGWLGEAIARVKAEVPAGSAVVIASYGERVSAAANMTNARRKYGPVEASGLQFAIGAGDNGRYGLFVKFTPDAITKEGQAAFAKLDAERKTKLANQAKARKAKA